MLKIYACKCLFKMFREQVAASDIQQPKDFRRRNDTSNPSIERLLIATIKQFCSTTLYK